MLIRLLDYVEIVSEGLETAVAAADAVRAIAVVFCEHELSIDFSSAANSSAVCCDYHALGYGGVAGGDELVVALYFYDADAACADFIECFEVTKCRDFYPRFLGGHEYGCALFDLYNFIINS
jgi:hypothetical protein